MFDKGKRAQRQSEDDRVFNRMLLWLAGAVVVELLFLLLQKVYVNMIFGGVVALGFSKFFQVFAVAGIIIAIGCVVWAVLNGRSGKAVTLPVILAAVSAGLWVVSVLCSLLWMEGVQILLMLPPAAAVLIVIFFLYQRVFFYNAILTGGGLLALWLHKQYFMTHPTIITACIVGGVVVLAAAAVLAFQLSRNDGKLGKLRVMPVESNYLMTFLTCAITAIVMVLGRILGVNMSQYLMYVLVGWLFAQAVFFTVKMM